MNELKQLRIKEKKTQAYCANVLHISLRSYKDYENNPAKETTIKYQYLLSSLQEHFEINETKGILSKDFIINTCAEILKEYDIDYCYLFGSYAKGNPSESSDVELLISISYKGFRYYELLEKLKERLHKNINLIETNLIINKIELINEILMTGERIYQKSI
jgi:hypothetical protein